MSSNLGAVLFDRSIGHFSSARRTFMPINPQDFDRTFVVANLANNLFFVKLATSSSTLHVVASL